VLIYLQFYKECLWGALTHCFGGPCHHDMVRLRVVDGGDGLQIWRVAANILNKPSRKADKSWSFYLGFGREANKSLPLKNISLLRNITQGLEIGQIIFNDLLRIGTSCELLRTLWWAFGFHGGRGISWL